jgi:hypothetical protein
MLGFCMVVEETEESEYGLKIINKANLSNNHKERMTLTQEANEIAK